MNSELLNILACPRSQRKLLMAPKEVIEKVNKMIVEEKCFNLGGRLVKEPIQKGLYEPIQKLLYVITDNIPVLLVEEAIQID